MEARTSPVTPSVPQRIPINMWHTDDALVVVAAMPGVQAEDIAVLPHVGILELRADLRAAASRRRYLVHEWDYGNYARMVRLPDGYGGPVTASFGNGQLAVRIGRGEREPGAPAGAVPVWDVGVPIGVHDAHDHGDPAGHDAPVDHDEAPAAQDPDEAPDAGEASAAPVRTEIARPGA